MAPDPIKKGNRRRKATPIQCTKHPNKKRINRNQYQSSSLSSLPQQPADLTQAVTTLTIWGGRQEKGLASAKRKKIRNQKSSKPGPNKAAKYRDSTYSPPPKSPQQATAAANIAGPSPKTSLTGRSQLQT
jgi:hypothetical protein